MLSLSTAILAVVISLVISTKGNILSFYQDFLCWLDDKGLEWIAKPMGLCPKCLAGQLSLWIYLLTADYNVLQHIFFIAWTILLTEILTAIYGKIYM